MVSCRCRSFRHVCCAVTVAHLAGAFVTSGNPLLPRQLNHSAVRAPQLRMAASDPATLDAVIDSLMTTSQLPEIVAKNVKSVAQPSFFLRIAERADKAKNLAERQKYEGMATKVTEVLEKLVDLVEQKMDDSNSLAQIIVSSCAEPESGEFLLPLSAERFGNLRQSVRIHFGAAEGGAFLATIQAWVRKSAADGLDGMVTVLQKHWIQAWARKSAADGLDGMVTVLQKVMQAYAAEALQRALPPADVRTPAFALFAQLLEADPDAWGPLLAAGLAVDGSSAQCAVRAEQCLGCAEQCVGSLLSNASAELSNATAVPSSVSAVPSHALAVLSNASTVLSNARYVLSNTSAVLSNARYVLSNAAAVLSSLDHVPGVAGLAPLPALASPAPHCEPVCLRETA
ncbi:hypothetical protein JKP88DRAFT_266442 [Tribonema minus]|uniref:Uncharacterized protein n=1 Tax=Tribonema minus TaxID=303371 RepID=A0A835ZDJ0_9STRA|nr:hypothetical protein JKP88DRAFT_266442 [Tribonema minus]